MDKEVIRERTKRNAKILGITYSESLNKWKAVLDKEEKYLKGRKKRLENRKAIYEELIKEI